MLSRVKCGAVCAPLLALLLAGDVPVTAVVPAAQPVVAPLPQPVSEPRAPQRASRSRQTPVLRHAQRLPAVTSKSAVPPILLRIRSCESGGGSGRSTDVNYRAKNTHTTASGAYQVMDGTWDHYRGYRHASAAPAAVQDAFAVALLRARGTQPWFASRHCWR